MNRKERYAREMISAGTGSFFAGTASFNPGLTAESGFMSFERKAQNCPSCGARGWAGSECKYCRQPV